MSRDALSATEHLRDRLGKLLAWLQNRHEDQRIIVERMGAKLEDSEYCTTAARFIETVELALASIPSANTSTTDVRLRVALTNLRSDFVNFAGMYAHLFEQVYRPDSLEEAEKLLRELGESV